MCLVWICFLLAFCSVNCLEADKKNELQLVVEYPGNRTYCDKMEVVQWTMAFHNCYFDRKYKDGGLDINNIVDRILQHAVQCQEMSVRKCQPDFQGFKDIMNKIIQQIKDYSEMYLAEIHKGREQIKDLQCVENDLSLNTYVKCFQVHLRSPSVSQKSFERNIQEGIACIDRSSHGCSVEAKSSLERIVGKIFGIIKYQQVTKPPPPKTTEKPYEKPLDPVETTEAPPAPYRWYDYIIQPFVSAWHYIRDFFG